MRFLIFCIAFLGCFPGPIVLAQSPNIYQILSHERKALQCRLDIIQQANKEILISTYAIKDDVVGLAMLQILIKTAARGVSVQLLVDDFDNGLPDCLFTYLEEKGVHTKVFNILNPFKFRTIVERMHGKMLIADGKILIVGGRNLTEKYYQLDSTSNFLDREVYIASDSAAQHARQHFRELWNNPKLSGHKRSALTEKQRECWKYALEQASLNIQQRLQLAPLGQKNWSTGVKRTAQPVHFIHDNYSYYQRRKGRRWRAHKDRQATAELIALISKAEHHIDIENPYFIPTRRWRNAFKQCLKRGVKIRLLTNSSYTNDLPLIEAVYLNRRARVLRSGIEIWEYRGTKMLHTKAMVIDDKISAIGSYNLDKLSDKYNAEVVAWVDDPSQAALHLQIMKNVLKRSIQVGKKVENPGSKRAPPSKIQRKRHRKVQFLRFTLAPLAGIIM